MRVSVVIPVYNEEMTILSVIKKVRSVDLPFEKEIIVVDDCSNDRTRQILEDLTCEKNGDVKIYYHERNEGKGAALKTGFSKTTGDIVIIQDADLEYNPEEYPVLMTPILENKADVVYGSRFKGSGPHRVLYFWHFVGNKCLTLLSNMFTNLNLSDLETCYKVFTRDVIKRLDLKEKRFGVEPEITAKVAKLGCRVYEVGISYAGRTYAEGKKISWKDGLAAIWCIIKYGF